MELIKENFWTLFCLIVGAVLTIIGTVRLFMATNEFNKKMTNDTKTIISGQDSILFNQLVSSKVEERTEKLTLESKELLEHNKKLDKLNHDILNENRLLNIENRNLTNQTRDIISENVSFIETNPTFYSSSNTLKIEYLNSFSISMSNVRVSFGVENATKSSIAKISFRDTRNIKNAKVFKGGAYFEYEIIHGWSSHSPIEIDLTNFSKRQLYLVSSLTLKNGVSYRERIYIYDYTQKNIYDYTHFEYSKNGELIENYKRTGKNFPKNSEGNPDLKIFD